MSETTDLALRIGLAAQQLDCQGPEPVVHALKEYLGLPFTEQKFSSIDPVQLSLFLEKFQVSDDYTTINKVADILQNGMVNQEMPADPVEKAPSKGIGAVRVAMASNGEGILDGHFGSCKQFLIYDISLTQIKHVGTRYTFHLGKGKAMDTEKNRQRVDLLRDCNILCVQSIGGPPAARVVNSGIMPLKYPVSQPLEHILNDLQDRLKDPPPWIKKVWA